jgi:small subunit ribosomal protein S4
VSKRANRKFSISRRIGEALWGSDRDPYNKKNYPPGQHGASSFSKRKSEYGRQLLAKQTLKMYYGDIREKQFRSIFAEAKRVRGDTGENLIGLLESRLDAFIYRCKLVPTVFAARQFVSHKHVMVNGETVNIPSYFLKVNDVVEVNAKSKDSISIADALSREDRKVPGYIAFDEANLQATYKRIPVLTDVPYPVIIEPHHIVEFYSR